MSATLPPLPARGLRAACLAALPAAGLRAAAECIRLTEGLSVTPLALPSTALRLLRLRDGALGESFFLGEIPTARAHLAVAAPDGRVAEGGAEILSDDDGLAVAIALLDAVIEGGLPGAAAAEALLAEGAAAREATEAMRAAMLARTRVDFSTLDEAQEDGDADA
jgi:alpha-D-ribose 1-methylphosphonate 5-triphosphate synthase subunit PhnG